MVFALCCLAFLGLGCGDTVPRVVEEDKSAPLRFGRVRMEEEVRRGPDLGLRVWARVDDRREEPRPFHLRFSLRDSLGKPHRGTRLVSGRVLEPELDMETGDTICWEYQSSLVPGTVRKFDLPDMEMPPAVEFFLPYHWLNLPPGRHRIYLDMEAVEGDIPAVQEDGFAGQWAVSDGRERLGYMQVELDTRLPRLYPVRVVVNELELDVTAFDPHTMDFYLLAVGERYGYPDLYWSLGIGYENVYNSDYFHNSTRGEWAEGTGTVYVRGPEEAVSLCAIDWDNEEVLSNRHDEIGCWEGTLGALSRDSSAPSILRFHHVERMEVYVDWIRDE